MKAFRVLAPILAALASVASAHDKLEFGIAPAWVAPIVVPPASASGPALTIRLLDWQTYVAQSDFSRFSRYVTQVRTPEALAGAGTIAVVWQPETDRVIVHNLLIHRSGQTIDVLKSGQSFTIVRRESGLESAMIDGMLTATLQISDLRVGDSVEFAMTLVRSNPILKGHAELVDWLGGGQVIENFSSTLQHATNRKIVWRAGPALPPISQKKANGSVLSRMSATMLKVPVFPANAPPRYGSIGKVEMSDFASWAEVAALTQSLYQNAARLAATSPLQSEIRRIAEASADPKKRAEAALTLVQQQVRYVANLSGLGSYLPANADEVWTRRYGDCKGKTAVLIALLSGLGIDAKPALVSAQQGDGLDQSLPMMGRFDHILVKAVIGGRVYWLDGTRAGDTNIDQIETPDFRWALPIEAGAKLERLLPSRPTKPLEESRIDIDARAGVAILAPTTAEAIVRGDDAVRINSAYAFMATADRERMIKEYWTREYDFLEVETAAFTFDKQTREGRFTATGKSRMDWSLYGGGAKFRYTADGSRLGYSLVSDRVAGAFDDAPVEVNPVYSVHRQVIQLPAKGVGFFVEGEAVDQQIGGIAYRRTAAITNGRFEMTVETRATRSELSLADAKSADKATDALYDKPIFVRMPFNYALTEEERREQRKQRPEGTDGRIMRAAELAENGDLKNALVEADAAIASDRSNADYLAIRGGIHAANKDLTKADADWDAALAIDPNNFRALGSRANNLVETGRRKDAAILIDRILLIAPQGDIARRMRVENRLALGDRSGALADLDILIRQLPDDQWSRIQRVKILASNKEYGKALSDADDYLKLFPNDAVGRALRGNVLALLKRPDEARVEIAASLVIEPTSDAYVTRAQFGLSDPPSGVVADAVAAVGLEPDRVLGSTILKAVIAQPDGAAQLSRAYDKAVAAQKQDSELIDTIIERRIQLEEIARQIDAALRSYDQIGARHPDWAIIPNNKCWLRATRKLDLAAALKDCDKALSLAKLSPYYDSRGLVRLQMGDYAAAIADYDEALRLYAKQPSSLYGRGLAKLRLNDAAGSLADIEAARKINPGVEAEFASYGLKP